MNKKFLTGRRLVIYSLAIVALVALFLANNLYAKNYPGGKYFQTQWIATRAVLLQKDSPYSSNVLYLIQTSAYDRPAMSGEYEFRFTYPYYSLALFLPFGLISNFTVARAAWMLLLEILIMAVLLLSLNLANWKPNLRIGIVILIFFATYYHSLRAIIDGNLIIVSTFLFILTLIFIRDNNDEAAGILAAGLTMQLQYFLLILIVITWFAISKKRLKIIGYFLGTISLLLGFSFLFQPDWATGYAQQLVLSIQRYPFASFPSSLDSTLGALGKRTGLVITILTAIILCVEWYLVRGKSFKSFEWFLFVTLIYSQFIGLPADAGNFVVLLPGLLFIFQVCIERWKVRGEMTVFLVCAALFGVTWLMFFIFRGKLPAYSESIWYYAVLPIIEMLLLYWSKWWIHKNPALA